MKDLVSLIERYRPGFTKGVVPASDKAIGSLEYLAGPVPGAYLRFLRTMGDSLRLDSVHLGIDESLDAHLGQPSLRHERYMYLCHDRESENHDYYWMDRAAPVGADDCALVVSRGYDYGVGDEPPRTWGPFAASLEDFLYFEVFCAHVVPSFEHALWGSVPSSSSAKRAELALEVPLGLGFTRRPVPHHNGIFEREDAAIAIRRDRNGFVGIYLAAHEPREIAHFSDAFAAKSGWTSG